MTAQRILICLHDFSRGGTERIAAGLAGAWTQAGRDVTILAGSNDGGLREGLDRRIKVVKLDPPVRRSLFSRFRLAREMGKHLVKLHADVIFLPGNFHAPLANGLRAADPKPKIALKISNPPLPQKLPFAKTLFRHFTEGVDGFAAMNSGLARQLKAMLPDRDRDRDIVTLHDPVYIRPLSERPRREDGRSILWIGRLEPQKDPVLALKIIRAMDPSARLTMLGEGGLRGAVHEQIAEMNLKDRVSLMGHVREIEPHLARSDALLITSRYEGGPAVAVEALAAGLPVVSTDCSFLLRDLMVRPEAGRLVAGRNPARFAKVLEKVCAQPRAPEVLRGLVAPFEPQACAQAYLDWFDRLVAHG
jgi:glycosyltransferase involved in cell wall biosynthesis